MLPPPSPPSSLTPPPSPSSSSSSCAVEQACVRDRDDGNGQDRDRAKPAKLARAFGGGGGAERGADDGQLFRPDVVTRHPGVSVCLSACVSVCVSVCLCVWNAVCVFSGLTFPARSATSMYKHLLTSRVKKKKREWGVFIFLPFETQRLTNKSACKKNAHGRMHARTHAHTPDCTTRRVTHHRTPAPPKRCP